MSLVCPHPPIPLQKRKQVVRKDSENFVNFARIIAISTGGEPGRGRGGEASQQGGRQEEQLEDCRKRIHSGKYRISITRTVNICHN